MVVLADLGKGFWVRVHAGSVLTPAEHKALADETSVQFAAIPLGALADDDEEPNEPKLRSLWSDSVSVVPKDQELPLWFLDGRPIKNDQLTALPPAERDRVKTKTVPAVCFSEGPGGKLDDSLIAAVSQPMFEALMKHKAEIAARRSAAPAAKEAPAQQPAPAPARLLAGSVVEICGLQAKPELNGKAAKVMGYLETRERYNLLVEGSEGSVIAVRRANMRQEAASALPPAEEVDDEEAYALEGVLAVLDALDGAGAAGAPPYDAKVAVACLTRCVKGLPSCGSNDEEPEQRHLICHCSHVRASPCHGRADGGGRGAAAARGGARRRARAARER